MQEYEDKKLKEI